MIKYLLLLILLTPLFVLVFIYKNANQWNIFKITILIHILFVLTLWVIGFLGENLSRETCIIQFGSYYEFTAFYYTSAELHTGRLVSTLFVIIMFLIIIYRLFRTNTSRPFRLQMFILLFWEWQILVYILGTVTLRFWGVVI